MASVIDTGTGNYLGCGTDECGEHRTVVAVRAWCFACNEWCYPQYPCVRGELARERGEIETDYSI